MKPFLLLLLAAVVGTAWGWFGSDIPPDESVVVNFLPNVTDAELWSRISFCFKNKRDIDPPNDLLMPRDFRPEAEFTVTGEDNVKRQVKSSLHVELQAVKGTSKIQGRITNNGTIDLQVFNYGNLLDPRAVQKVQMFTEKGNEPLQFTGISFTMVPDFDYDGKYWTSIKTGKTYNVEFNAAGLYDLSAGGSFRAMVSQQYVIRPSGDFGSLQRVYVQSNLITTPKIDPAKAVEAARLARLDPESGLSASQTKCQKLGVTVEDHSCSADMEQRIKTTLIKIADECRDGLLDLSNFDKLRSSRFNRYFHTSLKPDACRVARNLAHIMQQLQVRKQSELEIRCDDPYCQCGEGTLAYNSIPMTGSGFHRVVNLCPQGQSRVHNSDMSLLLMGQISLSEVTMRPALQAYSVPMDWQSAVMLKRHEALDNAWTYAFFVQCKCY